MKTTKLLLLMTMLLLGANGAQAATKTAKAVLSSDGKTLTFVYNDQKYNTLNTKVYMLNSGTEAPGWLENKETITTVVFDNSFKDARPTSCYQWFKDMVNLTSVEMKNPSASESEVLNFLYFNTSVVTTMKEMFSGCSSLATLPYLYRLSTSNVTDMSSMFKNCSALTNLNLGNHSFMSENEGRINVQSQFRTTNVTTMASMFSGCTNLSSLIITNFDTSSVTNMQAMFQNCCSLSSLNLSKFSTSSVENMAFMFNQCRKLQTINGLGNFVTSNVTTMQQMFAWCSGLKQLNLPFNTSSVEHMEYMFGECTHLISADISSFVFPDDNATIGLFMGCTALSQLTVSATASNLMLSASSGALTDVGTKAYPCYLICVDGFTPEPEETGAGWFKWKGGYFTESLVAMPYAALKDNVLTFRYDDQKMALFSEGADVYPLNEALGQPGWWGCSATTVVFDPSFVEARPTSCAYWFCDMIRLTSIEGIEYLNTSEVTNMEQMFAYCHNLRIVDVSQFNTSKVENMKYMFYECANLFNLDISNFDLPTENTDGMFANSSINHLTIPECAAVLSENACVNMNTETNPWELICPAGFTPVPQETGDGWIKWKGGYFTVSQMEPYAALKDNELTFHYDAQKDKLASEGASVFGLNEGANKPGWEQNISLASDVTTVVFNASFAKVKPKSCAFWFNQMYNLKSIEGLKYLNTSEVTTMEQMFAYCHNLRIVDVSQFNTSKVENMKYMFYECANLFNLDISNFDLPTENTDGMFANSSINHLTIPECAAVLSENACVNMNTETNPWELICPAGFTPVPQETGDGWIKWKGGYFTVVQKEMYAILEENVLTFKYDLLKSKNIADGYTVFDLNDAETSPGWYDNRAVVTKVIFDESFALAKPVSCRTWFNGMYNLQKIECIENLNTSEVTSMLGMFTGCERLVNVDLSHFNTSKVTTMRSMFKDCTRLESLDLSHFDTSKVTTMYAMFHGCKALESLDLSHFDTSLVEDMGYMFMKSDKLTSIEGLDKFNTSNVTSMYQMFYSCSRLQQVDVSHFNTSKVENMAFMFIDCSSLTSVNISNFDFKEGCINNNMFQDCTSLGTLYVSASAANLRTYDTGNDPFDSGSCVGVGTEENPCRLICANDFEPVAEETGEGWIKWKSGYFIVCRKGDVNDDGQVTVADVMLAVNKALGKPVSYFNEATGDMNNDGIISVADVMQIVKLATN